MYKPSDRVGLARHIIYIHILQSRNTLYDLSVMFDALDPSILSPSLQGAIICALPRTNCLSPQNIV